MYLVGKRFSTAIQALTVALMAAALAAACGGGSNSARTYTTSVGVGEVLQFTVDAVNTKYSYRVQYTSYGASGVTPGQNSGGALLFQNPDGSYSLGPSSDGFILGGKVLALQSGLLAGNVQLRLFGSGVAIPVFGLANPVANLAAASGVYNYQGFSCSASAVPNVLGNPACTSHIGTLTINASGAVTRCRSGDINTSPAVNACVMTVTGSLVAQPATPAVFDFRNAANVHIGWFFGAPAANGQQLAVIDHDDAATPEYGLTVLSTYANAVAGAADGSYLVDSNESAEQAVKIAGTTFTTTAMPGATGTLAFNSPWPGLSAYQLAISGVLAASGVALAGGTGAYASTSRVDAALFSIGARYGP